MRKIETLLPFLVLIALSSWAFGNTVVVPNNNLINRGNTSDPYPTTPGSLEIQELLGSGQFHSSPITITGISFRAAPGTGPVNAKIGSLTVTVSTSPNFPNTIAGGPLMSSTFANNAGPDKTMVFSGSNIVLSDPGCAAGAPCNFNLSIVFQKPFVYSPSNGSLLIDMVETNLSGTSGALDAAMFSAPGGSVATVAGTAGSATGTFAYSGPVVQVNYTTTAPSISGVVNVASNIPPGMPNYAIAQGSLFAVYGSGMGPTALAVSHLPLSASGLSGTSMTIMLTSPTGATVAVTPLIYFTRQDVVVAVMPSNAPPGSGSLTLTYNGQTGNLPITVTQTGFGISNNVIPFASNGIGVLNTAAVTFPNYQPVTTTYTAKPGDILTVWGTGLGPTPNGDDTNGPPAGNIGPAPQVFVGGIPSPSVSYWGRAPGTIPGLDQINFQVPPNAPLGCNVSIVVETMNGSTPIVSNAPTIALASSDGATCSDPTQLIPPSDLGMNSAKVFVFQPKQTINITGNAGGPASGTISGRAEIDLFQVTQAQIAALAPGTNAESSFGSCYVGINANPDANGPFNPTPLNAGSTITLTSPTASGITLTDQASGPGFYRADLGSTALPPNGTFTFPGGTWTFSDGAGGPDVGPLNFSFPVPQPILWMNRGSLISSNVDRSSPLTILWSGGDSNGYVDIQGYAYAGSPLSGYYYVGFECATPVSSGQFTIPSSILLAMPPLSGTLQVTTVSLPNILGAIPGFDVTLSNSNFQVSIPVTFK
ncbi:MAG TPA: hypothetical protein VKX39_16120 [Bryobacteraceae bacterium]|nr:hypothetical protein [Bryobacteraceae bacterium]